jgi:hypothetical protein
LLCFALIYRTNQPPLIKRGIVDTDKNTSHLPSQHTPRCTERADLQYGLIVWAFTLRERNTPSTNLQNRAHQNGSTDTLIQASIFTRSPLHLNPWLYSALGNSTSSKEMIELNQTASENLSVGSSIADRTHTT